MSTNKSMRTRSLEHTILSTICFFDALSYPLTITEIQEFLLFFPDEISATSIITVLESLCARSVIESSHGMYVLAGRRELIDLRQKKYVPNAKKYRIACRVSRLLACIPFVRMIGVVNTLAISIADEESDIDLFIVAKHKHIWLTRLLVVTLLAALKKRPTASKKKNKICTCFFASERALDFARLQIPPSLREGMPDIYFAWWVSRFVPIYDQGGYAKKVFDINTWAQELFPHRSQYLTIKERRVFLNAFEKFIKRFGELFFLCMGQASEHLARLFQLRILPQSIRTLSNLDTRVVLSDDVLKFHVRDMRESIRQKFLDTCKIYDIHFFR